MLINPQKEDGNTGINNIVLENLIKSGLNGTEMAVCLFIIRKTWGYNKKTDEISISQFMDAIPATKPSICKALSNLQLVKVIKLVKKGKSKNSSNEWEFCKFYDQWQLVKKSKLVKKKKLTSKENFTHNIKEQKKEKDTNVSKKKYGELKNVKLTDEQYKNLTNKLGGDLERKINDLSYYLSSTGKKYKCHYSTILNWIRKEEKEKPVVRKKRTYSEILQEEKNGRSQVH